MRSVVRHTFAVDEMVLRFVNALARSEVIATTGWFLSSRWVLLLVFGMLGGVLLYRRRFVAVLTVALAAGGADALTARVLKPVFDRERPCRELEGLVVVAPCGVGKSFPSGHAAVSFAVLTSAAPLIRFGWWMLAPLAVSVAGSRVLLGVHYPSDVLWGAFLGASMGWGMTFLRKRYEHARPLRKSGMNE